MKILLIILGVILALIVIVQVFAFNGRKNIESYSYQVLKKYKDFEIRNLIKKHFLNLKSVKPCKGANNILWFEFTKQI